MFQYAFARALQARGGKIVVHWHGSRTMQRQWGLDAAFRSPLSEKITVANGHARRQLFAWVLRKTRRQREPAEMSFNPRFLEAKGGYLDGYWQSERYFAEIAATIRGDFQFRPLTGRQNLELQTTIAARPCVAVHIRRGDYVGHAGLGGVCTPAYYARALAVLERSHPGCTPIIFSDDMPYCRALFAGQGVVYSGWNSGEDSWMDMALMAQCPHHIIANSTFSWWGAWLGRTREGRVIGPRNWFSDAVCLNNYDIYPDNWMSV